MDFRARVRAVAAIVSIMLILSTVTACTSKVLRSSIDVRAGVDAVMAVDDSFEIRIPGSSIEGEGTLRAEKTEQHGLSGWSVSLSGATLIGEAELLFDYHLTGDEPAPVAVYNENDDEPLLLGSVAESVDDDTYRVRTDHFSNWFLIGWNNLLDKGSKPR